MPMGISMGISMRMDMGMTVQAHARMPVRIGAYAYVCVAGRMGMCACIWCMCVGACA
jgi:hypothetical protein